MSPTRPARGRGPTRRPGALEREVLGVLAASDAPMTPAQVLAEVGGELAYTTVMTTLSRLQVKGVVFREPAGRGYAYGWINPSTRTARGMIRLLDDVSDRAAVLARFAAELHPDDSKLLEELLAEGQDPQAPESAR